MLTMDGTELSLLGVHVFTGLEHVLAGLDMQAFREHILINFQPNKPHWTRFDVT